MTLFQRSFYGPDPSFAPLFRFMDDFDAYSRQAQGTQDSGKQRQIRYQSFNPKFDVRETESTYELHGELPGIERKNVIIEFTDPQTLVVRGRIERSYQNGTPPTGLRGSHTSVGAIIEGGEIGQIQDKVRRKVTIEDETAAAKTTDGSDNAKSSIAEKQEADRPPSERIWVSERSVGEFSRCFSFPARVDEEAITAQLDNGILHISVAKANKPETRRITVH